MGDPRDDRNIDELWVYLCIALELRHDCGDADVSPEDSEDIDDIDVIDFIDDPRDDTCIRE